MTTDRRLDPLFRITAFLIVTAGLAAVVHRYDATLLARMSSMSAEAYYEHARQLHQHSYLFHFMTYFIAGGIYVGAIEFLVYLMRLCVPARGSID